MNQLEKPKNETNSQDFGGDDTLNASSTRKSEEINHFLVSLSGKANFGKILCFRSSVMRYGIASLGHGFASQKPETRPQSLNFPQNLFAQWILFEFHTPTL